MTTKKIILGVIAAIAVLSGSLYSMNALDASNTVTEEIVQYVSVAEDNLDLNFLAKNAEYVIVGTVTATNAVEWINAEKAAEKAAMLAAGGTDIMSDREILTDVTLSVQEDLFGVYTQPTITVRVPGGSMNGVTTINDSSPIFTVGERVTIFVTNGHSYNISSDHYTVSGLTQGTIDLNSIASSKHADNKTTEQQIKDKIKALKPAEM